MGLIDAILNPLELVVAWIRVAWHKAFTLIGLPAACSSVIPIPIRNIAATSISADWPLE